MEKDLSISLLLGLDRNKKPYYQSLTELGNMFIFGIAGTARDILINNLLNDFDKKLFNIINVTKKDRISISEINSLKLYFGDEDDLDMKIEKSLKVFRENAILEYLGKGEFKKAFRILNK